MKSDLQNFYEIPVVKNELSFDCKGINEQYFIIVDIKTY